MLAYQGSDLETQNLSKVKAHDVHSMAASFAFKGGVSLNQILGACFLEITHHIYKFLLERCGLEVKRRVRRFPGFCGFCPVYSKIIVCISYEYNYNSLFISNLALYCAWILLIFCVHSEFSICLQVIQEDVCK